MASVEPQYSKSRIDLAGKRVANGFQSYDSVEQVLSDRSVIENWRASHSHIINTFQASLRQRARKIDDKIVVAQRLKRFPTLVDKLKRFPKMRLSQMQDIAGCRVILNDVDQLMVFRSALLKSRAKHMRVSDERYNYISNPKQSGYRGIHEVYRYVGRGQGQTWDGLMIEIQLRTRVQHAWATAVEILDIIQLGRNKFGEGKPLVAQFVQVTSEMLARAYENTTSCLPKMSNEDLISDFRRLEKKGDFLKSLTSSQPRKDIFLNGNSYIILRSLTNGRFEVKPFAEHSSARQHYFELEREYGDNDDIDIVLVGADSQDELRYAFTNYFGKSDDFLHFVAGAVNTLSTA